MKSENSVGRIARAVRGLARVRLLLVLIALLFVPALALPFAERLRTEWARYWEPETDEPSEFEVLEDIEIPLTLAEVRQLESVTVGDGGFWTIIPNPADRPDDLANADAEIESVLIDFSDERPVPQSAEQEPDLADDAGR